MKISFCDAGNSCHELSNEDFARRIQWKSKADSKLKSAAKDGKLKKLTEALAKDLRAPARRMEESLGSTIDELLPDVASLAKTDREKSLFARVCPMSASMQAREKRGHESPPASFINLDALDAWLDNCGDSALSIGEWLQLSEILVSGCNVLPNDTFFRLWRLLFESARDRSNADVDPREQSFSRVERILEAESRVRAGLIFGTVSRSDRWRKSGSHLLQQELEDHTDTDGTPHAAVVSELSSWLMPLLRGSLWAESFERAALGNEAVERLDVLCRYAAGLLRSDGRFAFDSSEHCSATCLLRMAITAVGWKRKSLISGLLDSIDGQSKKSRKPSKLKLTEFPVGQSDWAEFALLRNRLSIDADILALQHNGHAPAVDWSILGTPLVSGQWNLTVKLDGAPVDFDYWECVCWNSDEDGDYLELHQEVDGIRFERQLFLSRTQHFLIYSDSVAANSAQLIDLQSEWPVGDGLQVDHDVPTREVSIWREGIRARVFPLYVEQDRVLSTPGEVRVDGASVSAQVVGRGGLYAPVMIDWHPDRQNERVDWVKVTVCEDRSVVRGDIAAAYRIRCGNQQLLIYRSLKNNGRLRTFLGHHSGHESVVGQFHSTGNVEPLVLVEA